LPNINTAPKTWQQILDESPKVKKSVDWINRQRAILRLAPIANRRDLRRTIKITTQNMFEKRHPDLMRKLSPNQIEELRARTNRGIQTLLEKGWLEKAFTEEMHDATLSKTNQQIAQWYMDASTGNSKTMRQVLKKASKKKLPKILTDTEQAQIQQQINILHLETFLALYNLPSNPQYRLITIKKGKRTILKLMKAEKTVKWIIFR